MHERASAGLEQDAQKRGNERGSRMLFAIALFKLVKAVLLIAIGIGTLSLARDASVLETLRHWAGLLGFNTHGQLVDRAVSAALGIDHRRLQALSVGTFVYAAIFLIEGAGLLLHKHWAEYLTAIVTASFVPIEIYEMVRRASVAKGIGIAVNVVVVIYLVVRLWRDRRQANGEKRDEPKLSIASADKSF